MTKTKGRWQNKSDDMPHPMCTFLRLRFRLREGLSAVLLLGLLVGCSPIQKSYLRADYARVDRFKVKRIRVTVAPHPAARKDLGKLWLAVATNHIGQKKNFLIKSSASVAKAGDVKSNCTKGLEGWLHLIPALTQKGESVEASVEATLYRCRDGQKVWSTTAKGTWVSKDDQLKVLTESYTKKMGAAIKPFVAPSCRLLFTVLENLPNPKLNEADIMEKIQMGS